jgi:hypothetical protein
LRDGGRSAIERLLRNELSALRIDDVENPVPGHRHDHVPLRAVDGDIGHDHMKILGVNAGLVVPDIFAGVRFHRDDTACEQSSAADLQVGTIPKVIIRCRAGGTVNQQSRGAVVRDRVPHIAAAHHPPFLTGPSLRGHGEHFVVEPLGCISRDIPESPCQFAGVCVPGK